MPEEITAINGRPRSTRDYDCVSSHHCHNGLQLAGRLFLPRLDAGGRRKYQARSTAFGDVMCNVDLIAIIAHSLLDKKSTYEVLAGRA